MRVLKQEKNHCTYNCTDNWMYNVTVSHFQMQNKVITCSVFYIYGIWNVCHPKMTARICTHFLVLNLMQHILLDFIMYTMNNERLYIRVPGVFYRGGRLVRRSPRNWRSSFNKCHPSTSGVWECIKITWTTVHIEYNHKLIKIQNVYYYYIILYSIKPTLAVNLNLQARIP